MTQITLPPNFRQCPVCGGIQEIKIQDCISCGVNLKFIASASTQTPDAPAKRAVSDVLTRLVPFDSKGVLTARVYLTPAGVFKFPSLGKTFGNLYEHELAGYINIPDLRVLHAFYWNRNSDKQTQARYITYLPVLPLEKCITCQRPATRYDVVETTLVKGHPGFSMAGVSQEVVNRISTAWGMDREWIPVPYCSVHGMEKGCPVEVIVEENRKLIKTTDPVLSQAIAEKYGVPAKAGNLAQRTKFGGVAISGLAALVFLMINGAVLVEKYRDAGWDLPRFLKDNLLPNFIGLLIGIGLAILAIRWFRVAPSAVISAPSSAVPPVEKPHLQTQAPTPVQHKPVTAQDPVEEAIKELSFVSTARAEHIQMIKVLKDSPDPRAVRALVSAMFAGNNRSGLGYGSNEPFARPLELQAFRALIKKDPVLVDEDLKRVYSRQDTAERRADLILEMGEGRDARAVQLLFDLAGTGYLRDGEMDTLAFYHTLAGIAAKTPDLIQPYLTHGRIAFQDYAKMVLDIVSANQAFQKVYPCLDHENRQLLQKELSLPALSIPSPVMILKAVSQVQNIKAKPSAWECLVALKAPKVVDSLFDLVQHESKFISTLAGDLVRLMVDREVITQLMTRLEQNPSVARAELIAGLLEKWEDADAGELLGKVFRLAPSPEVVKILSGKITDPDSLQEYRPDVEAVFNQNPSLDTALLLARLDSPLPVRYLIDELGKETTEKHFHNQDDERKAQAGFESAVKAKSDALIQCLQRCGSEISLEAVKELVQMDDAVFTSHYYSMIDSEETDYVEKKTFSLSALREAASRELVKRV